MHGLETEKLQKGVNVIGYFQGQFGLGEAGRLIVSALEKQSIPLCLLSADSVVKGQSMRPYEHTFDDKPKYDVNIFCIDVYYLLFLLDKYGVDLIRGRYNIILFFWETSVVPKDRLKLLSYFDEIWAASRYNFDTLSSSLRAPVCHLPIPIKMDYIPGIPSKSSFELEDKFTFLFCFDMSSSMKRKNPVAIIEAFRRAFPQRNDVQLVIKSQNGQHHPKDLNSVLELIKSDSRIRWIDESMSQSRRYDLINACDCYISLHRAEGLGLTMAEAMLMEKPVIATGYSGISRFYDP